MPFQKGHGGLRKGVQNKARGAVRDIARSIVEDQEYLSDLRKRSMNGTLGPMEAILWAYAYGKPAQALEVSGPDGEALVIQVIRYADTPTPL